MKYLDVYPECVGCPVSKYCGTMVGSIRLCNSYKEEPYYEETYAKQEQEMQEMFEGGEE